MGRELRPERAAPAAGLPLQGHESPGGAGSAHQPVATARLAQYRKIPIQSKQGERMRTIKKAAITATMLFCTVGARASASTYDFTGVMLDGYGFDGQTVSGSLTVDTALYSHTAGDGSSWAQGYGDNSAGPGLMHATISLSGGFSMTLGSPTVRFPTAETYVYKNSGGMDEFIVDGGAELDDVTEGFIQLRTTDYIADASLMFPDAAPGNLSFDQRVRFNTDSSFDVGYFYIGNAGGTLHAGDFMLTSVSGSGVAAPVPEPDSIALMMAGLAVTCAAALRRRNRG
ncbi:MAG TPA: PEP-CTERM sorting domain-containing protein [Burkholderiaceae bacterium]